MHTDENKRYDKRNIDSNLQRGMVTPKDYESYLSRLPDASAKALNPDEGTSGDEEEATRVREDQGTTSKKGAAPLARKG